MTETASDGPDRAPCAECGESITLVTDECTHCGHNPGQEQYYGAIACIMSGGLLSIFIITAIIGIPLFLAGVVWAIVVWWRSDDPTPADEAYLEEAA